jgi:hypothetical protein
VDSAFTFSLYQNTSKKIISYVDIEAVGHSTRLVALSLFDLRPTPLRLHCRCVTIEAGAILSTHTLPIRGLSHKRRPMLQCLKAFGIDKNAASVRAIT